MDKKSTLQRLYGAAMGISSEDIRCPYVSNKPCICEKRLKDKMCPQLKIILDQIGVDSEAS